MKKLVLTITEQDINPQVVAGDRDNYDIRQAARAVVVDTSGSVGLMHATKRDYYKLPGGGIEAGEEILAGLARELMEELGCEVRVAQKICEIVEYRDTWELKQVSYCYIAEVIGTKGTPTLTDEEKSEGFEVMWVEDFTTAIKLVSMTNNVEMDGQFMRIRDAAILKVAQSLLKA